MSRSNAILLGMAALLLLTGVGVALRQAPIERDLVQRVELGLAAYAIKGLAIDATGRDLRIRGELTSRIATESIVAIADDVWGVRTVDVSGITQRIVLFDAKDPLAAHFDLPRIVRPGGDLSNPMDAGSCQRTLARLAAAGSIRFVADGASPMPDSYPLLNDLANVVYQCPQAQVLIGAHTDPSADGELDLRLSEARAKAVQRFFQLAGIVPVRTRVVAYGGSRPIASSATAEGRAANRRITFEVLPFR